MHAVTQRGIRWIAILLFGVSLGAGAAGFNAAGCASVAGTLNIFWEYVAGPPPVGCTGIEYTNGSLGQAATGTVTMQGVSVSNPSCIDPGTYTFTQSADRMSLVGLDTFSVPNIPMNFVRDPSSACYYGHWNSGPYDYVGYISTAPFPTPLMFVPALDLAHLMAMMLLLAVVGIFALGRRRSNGRLGQS